LKDLEGNPSQRSLTSSVQHEHEKCATNDCETFVYITDHNEICDHPDYPQGAVVIGNSQLIEGFGNLIGGIKRFCTSPSNIDASQVPTKSKRNKIKAKREAEVPAKAKREVEAPVKAKSEEETLAKIEAAEISPPGISISRKQLIGTLSSRTRARRHLTSSPSAISEASGGKRRRRLRKKKEGHNPAYARTV
jgi:hypothetical protein